MNAKAVNRPNRARADRLLGLPTGHPAHLALGLTVWCVWFVVVYGGMSVACAVVASPGTSVLNPINLTLGLITLLTTLALAFAATVCWQTARQGKTPDADTRARQFWFMARLSAALYALSAGATLFVGLPLLALPPCI